MLANVFEIQEAQSGAVEELGVLKLQGPVERL